MAFHARHVLTTPGEVRVQVKFRRTDLLYRHPHALRDPHADAKCQKARAAGVDPATLKLEVPGLPLDVDDGRMLVGPTLLDMLVRSRWRVDALPEPTKNALLADLAPGQLPEFVIAWSVRDLNTLWPKLGQPQRLAPRRVELVETARPLDHPFLASLASGGTPIRGAPSDEWIRVEKLTTCQVGEYVYRTASGVFGGLDQAYETVAAAALAAWDVDIQRALQLWDRVRAAPGEVLVETLAIEALRPICSISQEVERTIMREVCQWLGVDPDLPLKRPRGRPRSADANADQGRFIRVELQPDGSVRGRFVEDFEGVTAGTELHNLKLATLVSILGALRLGEHELDHQLLEAWLDAALPDWRERVTEEDGGAASSSGSDPYEVLGVSRDAPTEAITAAFRRTMKAVHPDTGGASPWIARHVIDAYKKIREARTAERTTP